MWLSKTGHCECRWGETKDELVKGHHSQMKFVHKLVQESGHHLYTVALDPPEKDNSSSEIIDRQCDGRTRQGHLSVPLC
jgi:hypothetical protein